MQMSIYTVEEKVMDVNLRLFRKDIFKS